MSARRTFSPEFRYDLLSNERSVNIYYSQLFPTSSLRKKRPGSFSSSRGSRNSWISFDSSAFQASHNDCGSFIRSDANSAVRSRHQEASASLTGELLQLPRDPYFAPHPYPSRNLHVTVCKGRILTKDLTSELVQQVYPFLSQLHIRAVLSSHRPRRVLTLPNG